MSHYRLAANIEWTSKCNARCIMCPRDGMRHQQLMTEQTFDTVLERLDPELIFRAVIAGHGEPSTHHSFTTFIEKVRDHPVRFDMVSNGHLLDQPYLRQLDGALDLVIISFSSIDPDVYRRVHVNLDYDRVTRNLIEAQKILRHTELAVSLTPLPECLRTLPSTITWLRESGITNLTMSPTLYNRAGNLEVSAPASSELRRIIDEYELHSQELDFVPSIKDTAKQWIYNSFKCLPRNSDIFITASGDYLFCYNDINHCVPIGHVNDMGVKDVLTKRHRMGPDSRICANCNMKNRYGVAETARASLGLFRKRLSTRRRPRGDKKNKSAFRLSRRVSRS